MFHIFSKNLIYFLMLCLLTQGCVPHLPKGNVTKEKVIIPKTFSPQDQKIGRKEENASVSDSWKIFFKDKNLVHLIGIALENNQELNILNQEINIANNEVSARQGEYLPKVGVGAGYENDKTSQFSSRGVNDENSGLSEKLHTGYIGFNASWEVDIFKKLRNATKSAYYEYLASIEGRNFAKTRLIAEIANAYYELMALDNQLGIIENYIKNLQEAEDVVKWQKIAGRSNALAVTRFTAEIAKNQGEKYRVEQQILLEESRLNNLLGRTPQKIKRSSEAFIQIETVKINNTIPQDLLNNRPDVKQAALKIEAAKLNVASVKAKFYPSLNIDANVGYQSFNSQHLISPESLVYNIAGNLTAPLLNRKSIKSEYLSANSHQIQAIYAYEKAFINAFTEVSNQLFLVGNSKKIFESKVQQTQSLSESIDISNVLFKAARIDYLESLLTRRDYLEAKIELIEAKKNQLLSHVNLYKSLGGGWR